MQIINILKSNRIIMKLGFSILVVVFLMSTSKCLEFAFIQFVLAIKFLTNKIESTHTLKLAMRKRFQVKKKRKKKSSKKISQKILQKICQNKFVKNFIKKRSLKTSSKKKFVRKVVKRIRQKNCQKICQTK